MKEKINLHYGHRQRLKDKVKMMGIENMPEHEILEFLLYYCIPYKDTNKIAHTLIKSFGSLSSVFNSSIYELIKIDGISEHTAIFINSLPKVLIKYNNPTTKIYYLPTSESCINYFRNNFIINNFETGYILCMNAKNNLIKSIEIKGNSPTSMYIDMRTFTENVLPIGTTSIVFIHTHPNGNPEPSINDDIATKQIITTCFTLGIEFNDHIILSSDSSYSYFSNNLQEFKFDIKQKLSTIFGNNYNTCKVSQEIEPFGITRTNK